MTATRWTVGELARRAGVTVRTLRHYDQRGLLAPSGYSEAGYRLYGRQALLQLQQILTLKHLGLPLEAIQRVLSDPGYSLAHCLQQQKQALRDELKRLQTAVETIEAVEAQVESGQAPESETLFKIMEVIQMKHSQAWVEQFYTPEQLAELAERTTADPTLAQRGTDDWNTLFAEIRAQMQHDPASPEVQALLPDWEARWEALINAFTGGNAGIRQGLNKMYASTDTAPASFQSWNDTWADVRQFLDQAKAARKA